MQLQLIYCAVFCLSLTLVDSKSYIFAGDVWQNNIRKCASGGGDSHKYIYTIGTLDSVGLKYEDIDQQSMVVAYGSLKGHTGAVDNNVPSIILKKYNHNGSSKTFYGEWGFTATAGWATQQVKIQLTIEFVNNGKVKLTNYVYAYSMMAVTCAETTSDVNKVELINSQNMPYSVISV